MAAFDAEGNKSRNSPPLVVQSLSLKKYFEDSDIIIYPVPASQELYITGKTSPIAVEIFDLTRRKLFEYKAEKRNQIYIDISMFQNGIYLVRINQEKGMQLRKIKIEH